MHIPRHPAALARPRVHRLPGRRAVGRALRGGGAGPVVTGRARGHPGSRATGGEPPTRREGAGSEGWCPGRSGSPMPKARGVFVAPISGPRKSPANGAVNIRSRAPPRRPRLRHPPRRAGAPQQPPTHRTAPASNSTPRPATHRNHRPAPPPRATGRPGTHAEPPPIRHRPCLPWWLLNGEQQSPGGRGLMDPADADADAATATLVQELFVADGPVDRPVRIGLPRRLPGRPPHAHRTRPAPDRLRAHRRRRERDR
ncbi:hypothetical protein SANTM175S_07558 [Streptomyces antimycoticus]